MHKNRWITAPLDFTAASEKGREERRTERTQIGLTDGKGTDFAFTSRVTSATLVMD